MKGFDVSRFSGDVNFLDAKKDGMKFVILRLGGRDKEGNLYKDIKFEEYYKSAKAAGLKVGVYWVVRATSVDEARVEARALMDALGDKKIDMPVWLDIETMDALPHSSETVPVFKNMLRFALLDVGVYTFAGAYKFFTVIECPFLVASYSGYHGNFGGDWRCVGYQIAGNQKKYCGCVDLIDIY